METCIRLNQQKQEPLHISMLNRHCRYRGVGRAMGHVATGWCLVGRRVTPVTALHMYCTYKLSGMMLELSARVCFSCLRGSLGGRLASC
jgi:hypothetical protein